MYLLNHCQDKNKISFKHGSIVRLVLANIIITECDKVIVDNLVKQGTIKFYVCYVDDTLLLVKCQDIDKVLKAFNGFNKNLKFTVARFENKTPHFLDLEICPNGLKFFPHWAVINMDSFTLWK